MLQTGRSWFRIPMRSLDLFNSLNISNHTMALGSTQSGTELSTIDLPRVKGDRRMRLTTSQPSVSRLSRKCVNLYCLFQELLYSESYLFFTITTVVH
jgi:hypothetical protein